MAQILLTNGAAQATPAAGAISLYSKSSDKNLYYKNETGLEIGPLNGLSPNVQSNFFVWQSTAQTIAATTFTLVNMQSKVHDDLNEFNTTTSLFTATFPGTYQFSGAVLANNTTPQNQILSFYKNGALLVRVVQKAADAPVNGQLSGTTPPVKLLAGDTIGLYYYEGAADTLFAQTTPNYIWFGGIRLK